MAGLDRRTFHRWLAATPASLAIAGRAAGASLPAVAGAIDVTDDYDQALAAGDDAALLSKLRAYRLLFVPGFLSSIVIDDRLGINWATPELGVYFDRQLAWLAAAGVAAARVAIQSEATTQTNAAIIADAIRAQPAPVVLITHSKGGLDTLEALLGGPADLRDRVRLWIAIQTPFFGSPIADQVTRSFLGELAGRGLVMLGGSSESVDQMRVDHRRRYMARHAPGIAALVAHLPVVSLGTYVARASDLSLPLLWPSYQLIELTDGVNDGAVTPGSAVLPGSHGIIKGGIDHVMMVTGKGFDAVRATRALLAVGLQIPDRRAAAD